MYEPGTVTNIGWYQKYSLNLLKQYGTFVQLRSLHFCWCQCAKLCVQSRKLHKLLVCVLKVIYYDSMCTVDNRC